MRVENAYRIVEKMRNRDRRYKRLISKFESKIESRIEFRKRFYCMLDFSSLNIDFTLRTRLDLTNTEIKAIRIYLNDKYGYYTWEYEIFIEHRKTFYGQVLVVKLI